MIRFGIITTIRESECQWMRTGEHEDKHKVVEDTVPFASDNINSVGVCLRQVSKETPSTV